MTMARPRKGRVRAAAQAVPAVRLTATLSRAAQTRRWRRGKTVVADRLNRKRTPARSSSEPVAGVKVAGAISGDAKVRRTIPSGYLAGETLERWGAIMAGQLPADDETPRPWSDEQIAELERAAIREAEQQGEAREVAAREDAQSQIAAIQARADAVAEETGRGAGRARARIESEIEAVNQALAGELARVADQVREDREGARAEIMREAQRREDAAAERVDELKAGLAGEVEAEVNRAYFPGGFEMEDFELL